MLGTLVHVGGPAPLRAGVTYAFPFERYVATSHEHCLRLPWVERHARDDVGVVEHEEQEVFVAELLRRCGIPSRTAAPGEHVFADAHAARRGAAVISAALGVPWGLTFDVEGGRATVELALPTPALVVRRPAIPGAAGAWADEARVGLDALAAGDFAGLVERWIDPPTLVLVHDAMRASPPRPPERANELVRTWSRTVRAGAPGPLDEVDALEIRPSGATSRRDARARGPLEAEPERAWTLGELSLTGWPLRERFAEIMPRVDAFVSELAREALPGA